MNCLNCAEEMVNYLVLAAGDQISYDICEACGSLWLDAGELDKMAFQVEGRIEFCSTEPVEGEPAPVRPCPRCEEVELDRVAFIGSDKITLERCGNCGGFWLDGGELDLINRELETIMPVAGKGFSDFVNNLHLPYWHKRVRRRSAETDFHVEVPPIPGAEPKAETLLECPACESNLRRYKIYGIQIEGCPQCKGIWADRDELRALKDRVERGTWRDLRWLDDELDAIEKAHAAPSGRRCPRCRKTELLSAAFADTRVLIDWCPSCHGTWLDRGEFAEIVARLRARLDEMSAEEVRKKVYEEIKEIWSGPEDKISEIRDARAAVGALLNVSLFEHPLLYKLLSALGGAGRSIGA